MQLPIQSLPTYTNAYVIFDGWLSFASPHYIFYFMSGSVAEREIDAIVKRQEQAWQKIVTTLKLETPTPIIRYYLYPDSVTKMTLMGDDGNAQAIWSDYSLHVVYNEKIKPLGEHEDTHLLTLPWGVSVGLLQEGLAEWLHGCAWNGKDSSEALRGKDLPPIESLLAHSDWANACDTYGEQITYPLAGIFVRDFVKKFGIDALRSAYQRTNREMNKNSVRGIFDAIVGAEWMSRIVAIR